MSLQTVAPFAALQELSSGIVQGLKHEESGSEDEWTEDEEEGTALQDIEPFSVVADTLRGVQAHNPARFQARPLVLADPTCNEVVVLIWLLGLGAGGALRPACICMAYGAKPAY